MVKLPSNKEELYNLFNKYDFNTKRIAKVLEVNEKELRSYMHKVLIKEMEEKKK